MILQQDVMRLLEEKQVLQSSERHLQDLLQRLEAELSTMQREKATEALEQNSQVGPFLLTPWWGGSTSGSLTSFTTGLFALKQEMFYRHICRAP